MYRAIIQGFRVERRVYSLQCCGFAKHSSRIVLGIETSCDDTGAAVVDEDGNILGEALHSQGALHVEMGGIIPPVARDLHEKHITNIVNLALQRASVEVQEYELYDRHLILLMTPILHYSESMVIAKAYVRKDLDAIATTVKPGLALSLLVGLNFSKQLVKASQKSFIPIHHMEAHALMARMTNRVKFPFLTLLISGGHSLLALVKGVDDFVIIGKGIDDAPGEAFDKTARRLKLKLLPQCSGLSGGASVEIVAKDGNPRAFKLHPVMTQTADCNFSFAGLKAWAHKEIEMEERLRGIEADGIIPNVADLCATFQYMVLHHLAKRIQRALLFCELKGLLPADEKVLVISGGVASNMFIRDGLTRLCNHYNCGIVCPPPRLCTDNGVMIAWNGMERLKLGIGIAEYPDLVDIQAKCPLGVDVSSEVCRHSIKLPRIKLLED